MITDPAPFGIPEPGAQDEEALEHMAQVLAHRLRGLVTSIEGFTDLLVDTLSTNDQRELALRILEGASRIENVLSDLQLYSEGVEPVILRVSLSEVLRELLAPVDDAARERITCSVDSQDEEAKITVDPYLLRQALLILIENALEATRGDQEVRLSAGVDHARGEAYFDVWNAGTIGVPEAEERVFMPFFTTKAHSLGVGLSIARRIARIHRGSVSLKENSETRGICFTIRVPLIAGAAEA